MTTHLCGYRFMTQIVHKTTTPPCTLHAFKAPSKLLTFNQLPPATDYFRNSECERLWWTNQICVVSYTLTHARTIVPASALYYTNLLQTCDTQKRTDSLSCRMRVEFGVSLQTFLCSFHPSSLYGAT